MVDLGREYQWDNKRVRIVGPKRASESTTFWWWREILPNGRLGHAVYSGYAVADGNFLNSSGHQEKMGIHKSELRYDWGEAAGKTGPSEAATWDSGLDCTAALAEHRTPWQKLGSWSSH